MSHYQTVGQPIRIHDGAEKVTGAVRYTPDVVLPGMLYARLVMSPHAHATIRKIDTSAALKIKGVYAVLTAHDLPDIPPSDRARLLLARGRTIFVGQPVALVLAETETAAEDGLEQVRVEYEPLSAATTFDSALAPNAPLVWTHGIPGSNNPKPTNLMDEREALQGDIAQGFAQADLIVEHTFTSFAAHHNYIETHGTVVQPDPTGGVTIWTSTQAAFEVGEIIADMFNLPESKVRVIPMTVGGGFGGKFTLYQPSVVAAALAVKRPVRLILSRMEDLAAANPAPAIRVHARLGAKHDGTLTALEAEVLADVGCYPANWLADFTGFQLRYRYELPHYRVKTAEVLTFKPSAAAYRAPCAPTATLVIETLMDELAEHLKRDALDLREQNLIRTKDGEPLPTHGAREVLSAAREHPLWRNREALKAQGRGVGVAFSAWGGAYSPSTALCMLGRDGRIQLQMASVDLNGTSTSFQMMVAETLNLPLDQITMMVGDTLTSPYAAGTLGSQVTYSTGGAVLEAAKEIRRQLLAVASDQLEAAVEDLEIVHGKVQVRGFPAKTLSFAQISAETRKSGSAHPPIIAHGRSTQPKEAPVFTAQLAEVEVDPTTGEITVHRIVLIQDVGFALNPLLIQGQMHGGVTQGIGWALYEQLRYDDNGQLLTGSLMDYTVPKADQTAAEIETILVEVASETGPLGARGVGENPVVATTGAIANAIYHASGLRLTDLPMTAPRVWEALNSSHT